MCCEILSLNELCPITSTTSATLPLITTVVEELTGSTGMSTFLDSLVAVLKRPKSWGTICLVCNFTVRNFVVHSFFLWLVSWFLGLFSPRTAGASEFRLNKMDNTKGLFKPAYQLDLHCKKKFQTLLDFCAIRQLGSFLNEMNNKHIRWEIKMT